MGNRNQLLKQLETIRKDTAEKTQKVKDKEIKLERIDYDAPSDDEIISQAKAYIEERYNKKADTAKAENQSKRVSFSEAIQEAVKRAENQKSQLESAYESAKDEVENQALKRGLQRSSVVVNQLGDLTESQTADFRDIDRGLDETVSKLNTQISDLEIELDKSLKDLDLEKAVATNDEIRKKKAERDEKLNEAIKYNNSAKVDEMRYNKQFYDDKAKEEIKKIEVENGREMASVALDYYLTFENKEEALKALESDKEVVDLLGEYYNYVYNAIKVS